MVETNQVELYEHLLLFDEQRKIKTTENEKISVNPEN